MAHAYTPGLRVAERTLVRKERRLPLKGEVLVKKGDSVKAETIVARTNLPGDVQTVNVAGLLGVLPEDVQDCMMKKAGDAVEKDEAFCVSKGFFGLFKSVCKAPVKGSIESISSITGQVIIREPPQPVQVAAYLDGRVVEVFEGEGVAVESEATFIQGIFGVGGETVGEIKTVTDDPSKILSPEDMGGDCEGKVLIGGSLVTTPAINRAIEVKARAIVVGGIADKDLKDFLGYDIGVAITGSEEKGITIVITEGFGKMRMADRTFNLLRSKAGLKASVNGATQIRAGVMRPEVIVPLGAVEGKPRAMAGGPTQEQGLVAGSLIRVIREPYFGRLAKVTALPADLQQLETEAKVRVLEAELEGGGRVILPRANVEMIEE